MNERLVEPPLSSLLRDHYLNQSIAEEKVDAILEVQQLTISVRRWQRIAASTAVGLAAMTVVAVTLFVVGGTDNGTKIVETQSLPTDTIIDTPVNVTPIVDAQTRQNESPVLPMKSPSTVAREPQYLLVAFRSHGDGCPFCRETGRTYRELKRSMRNDLVQLEQVHLGDRSQNSTSPEMLAGSDLDSLVAGRSETAFVALTTTDGKLVEKFKPSLGGAAIASRVDAIVSSEIP